MGQRELQFKWDGQRDRIIFEKKNAVPQILEGAKGICLADIWRLVFQKEGKALYTTCTKCCVFNPFNNPRKRFYYLCFGNVETETREG